MLFRSVENPIDMTYEELKAMPSVEQFSTLSCVSNKVGGDLISNAIWKGVPLKNLLEQAHVRQGAEYIVFRCFDGYDVGIPLEKGLEDGTILAYQMNREALTPAHGFPVRAIVRQRGAGRRAHRCLRGLGCGTGILRGGLVTGTARQPPDHDRRAPHRDH